MLIWPKIFLDDNYEYPKLTVGNDKKIKVLAMMDALLGWSNRSIVKEEDKVPKGFSKGLQKIAKVLGISLTLLLPNTIFEISKKYITKGK